MRREREHDKNYKNSTLPPPRDSPLFSSRKAEKIYPKQIKLKGILKGKSMSHKKF